MPAMQHTVGIGDIFIATQQVLLGYNTLVCSSEFIQP